MIKLKTKAVGSQDDIIQHFNRDAATYAEKHGNPAGLLSYRMNLIRDTLQLKLKDRVLELGCGTGNHLLTLKDEIAEGLGIDFSPQMIDRARKNTLRLQAGNRISFRTDDAQKLTSISENSFDAIFCVGSFEHMLDKGAVGKEIFRTLRPGGRVAILTLNADYVWYSSFAKKLNLDIKHLSSDEFLSADRLKDLFAVSGFGLLTINTWKFIPKGDMPYHWGLFLEMLDFLGRIWNIRQWRGGLILSAVKPLDKKEKRKKLL